MRKLNNMYNTLTTAAAVPVKQSSIAQSNIFTRFYAWTLKQEEKRFMWLAFTFLLQIGLALPCTLLAIVFLGGNNFNLWLIACVANVPSLALSLAAQPTKITLPVLFFAWLVNAGIILFSVVSFFMH